MKRLSLLCLFLIGCTQGLVCKRTVRPEAQACWERCYLAAVGGKFPNSADYFAGVCADTLCGEWVREVCQ